MSPLQSTNFEKIEELYKKYNRPAYSLALKILRDPSAAEDAVHEAFLRYWRNPGSYDFNKGSFIKWLHTVVHNICLDQLRKTTRNVSLNLKADSDWSDSIVDTARSVEDEVWLKLQQKEIQAALKGLSVEQRQCIELAFFKGLTHTQIASITSQPVGTIKSRIRQGLLKLKDQLDAATAFDQFTKKTAYSSKVVASHD